MFYLIVRPVHQRGLWPLIYRPLFFIYFFTRGAGQGGGYFARGGAPLNFWTNEDKCSFQQKHNQDLHQSILTMSWDLCAKGVLVSLFLFNFGNNARGVVVGP